MWSYFYNYTREIAGDIGACSIGLGDMDKIKYHNIFDPIPRYGYYDDIVEMTIGDFIRYLVKSNKFRKLSSLYWNAAF